MTVSSFVGENIMTFLGLPRLPGMLHMSGELFQCFYQALIDETKGFHFVRIDMHCFYWPRRYAVHVAWWILHPWRIGVAPTCVPS